MTTITSLSARNYKGVKEITIEPEGRTLVVVAGSNGAGKSSFIDAIAEIIDPKGTRLTAKPIRDGEKNAEAVLTTDAFTATRRWTKDDAGALKVTAADGAVYGKGRDFLVEQTGAALLEPFAFDALKDSEQRAELLSRVQLPFDLDELERRYSAAYSKRTDTKKEVDRLTAVLNSLAKPEDGPIPEETPAGALIQELQKATESNGSRARAEDRAEQLTREIDALELQLKNLRDEAGRVAVFLKSAPARIDVDEISTRLDNVEDDNRAIRAQATASQAWSAANRDLTDAVARNLEVETEIEQIKQTKADGLSKAVFPVEGLSVDADRIIYDGLPFKQVNSARRIAIAFELAASAHPGLRIAIIRNGDMLDDTTLAEVEAVAQKHDYLVLVERDRGNSREIGFTVADGEISA